MKFHPSRRKWVGVPLGGLALLTAMAAWGLGPGGGTPGTPQPTVGINRAAGTLTFRDLAGKDYTPHDIAAHKASVFLFVSGQCPVSNVYTPRMNALAAAYGTQGVQVFAVYSNFQESVPDIRRHAKEHGLTFPVVKDSTNALADRLGAKMTPEAIVVDSSGAVRYRGRIDDNSVATRVSVHDLNDALDAVLTGKPVAHPEMLAVGCAIRRNVAAVAAKADVPTYARDVAPILRAKCEGCHRPGEVSPFSLQTYSQASAWAADIKRYTGNGQMPPWKATPGYGEFAETETHTLSETERNTIAKWAENGAPLGDVKQMPPPRTFTQGWQLGEPDMVIAPEKAFHLSADGEDVFRNFVIKTNFTEDRYIRATELRPGAKSVVHHILVYVDGIPQSSGYASEKLEAATHDGQPGYGTFGSPGFLPSGTAGVWVPGSDPHYLPPGVGIRIPKGARFVIQIHYHKDGKPQTDLTRLGLYFCKENVQKIVTGGVAINYAFKIPAGDPHAKAEASWTVPEDEHLFVFAPHMHLLGKEAKLWATFPNGSEKPLLWIKDWEYNWQQSYFPKEPIALPKGTVLHLQAYYDNSSQNPRNPMKAKPRLVTWGEQTTDEMCVAAFITTRDNEHLNIPVNAPAAQTAVSR